MTALWLSAVLFGLVHSGSKLILQQQITLLPFCLLYVGIRLFVQAPLVAHTRAWKVQNRTQILCLIALGIIGAALQFSEFYGVFIGLPVPTVTFLVYTHPVWTLFLSRVINGEAITPFSVGKISLALLGVVLITGCQLSLGYSLSSFIMPVLAGLMIALWITVSNQAAKRGCSTKTISFYYDFFCFLILLVFCIASPKSHLLYEALSFCQDPRKLIQIGFYSVAIGLIPNYLFYYGSKTITAVTAGLILLLEPVFSAIAAYFIWRDALSTWFIAGAVAILATNLPESALDRVLAIARKVGKSLPDRRAAAQLAVSILLAGLMSSLRYNDAHGANQPTVNIIEIAPSDPTDYTVNGELRLIEFATELAVSKYQELKPQCHPKIIKLLKRGTEEELFTTIRQISVKSGPQIVVGFSRSNFARIAAKAASGTSVRGISMGASATNLREINPNFVSICSPWTRQADTVIEAMKRAQCTSENTEAIYDPKNYLSNRFFESYKDRGHFTNQRLHNKDSLQALPNLIQGKQCIFIPLQFSDAQAYIHLITKMKWKGVLFGVGDWNYYSAELEKVLTTASYPGLTVHIPTGWIPRATSESENFVKLAQEKIKEIPSPVGAYAFDATILALEFACRDLDPIEYQPEKIAKLPLLRKYESIGTTGNYLSPIFTVTFKSGGKL